MYVALKYQFRISIGWLKILVNNFFSYSFYWSDHKGCLLETLNKSIQYYRNIFCLKSGRNEGKSKHSKIFGMLKRIALAWVTLIILRFYQWEILSNLTVCFVYFALQNFKGRLHVISSSEVCNFVENEKAPRLFTMKKKART